MEIPNRKSNENWKKKQIMLKPLIFEKPNQMFVHKLKAKEHSRREINIKCEKRARDIISH